jgi:hypothetical protein
MRDRNNADQKTGREGENMMNQRQHVRQPIEGSAKLAMTVIPYEKSEKIEITAAAVDRGEGGMGIITDRALALGFVVITDYMGGSKKGVLVWTKQRGDRSYRSGIRIVPTHEEKPEQSQDVEPGFALQALGDPELFASIILDVAERGMLSDPANRDQKSKIK